MCLASEICRQLTRKGERETQRCVKRTLFYCNGTLGSCMSLHNRPPFLSVVHKLQFILPLVFACCLFFKHFRSALTSLASLHRRQSLNSSSVCPAGINASVITQLCMIILFCHALCVIACDICTVPQWGCGGTLPSMGLSYY